MSDYNPKMVTLARESRGKSQTELAELSRIPQGTISKIEAGALRMTDEVVSKLSIALDYPKSFFQQMDTVYPFGSSTFYHRKLQSVPAGVLRKIEARVNIYRMQAVRLLRSTDFFNRCSFKRYDAGECGGRVEEIAQLVRSAWRLPRGPVPDLTKTIEDAGGIVIRFSFGTAQMFGLSEWTPPCPPMFFINDNPAIGADRDRFTLAHELGHVLLHALPNPDMENEANRFAGEFLMPANDVRPDLVPPIKLHTVARLKPLWRVSMASLLVRANDLGVINKNQLTHLRIQMQQKGFRYREPQELDFPREQPTLLAEVLRAHVTELGYSRQDIAQAMNLSIEGLREYHPGWDAPKGLQIVASNR